MLALAAHGPDRLKLAVSDVVCPALCAFLRAYAAGLDEARSADAGAIASRGLGAPTGRAERRWRLARCRARSLQLGGRAGSRSDRLLLALVGDDAALACGAAFRLAGAHGEAIAFATTLLQPPAAAAAGRATARATQATAPPARGPS